MDNIFCSPRPLWQTSLYCSGSVSCQGLYSIREFHNNSLIVYCTCFTSDTHWRQAQSRQQVAYSIHYSKLYCMWKWRCTAMQNKTFKHTVPYDSCTCMCSWLLVYWYACICLTMLRKMHGMFFRSFMSRIISFHNPHYYSLYKQCLTSYKFGIGSNTNCASWTSFHNRFYV